MKSFIAILVVSALAACAQTKGVTMIHPQTGKTAQCGPYYVQGSINGNMAATMQEAQCIQDYKEQGYVRA